MITQNDYPAEDLVFGQNLTGKGGLRRKQPNRTAYQPEDPLLSTAEAAAEAGRAVSTFLRDVKNGRLPSAYYVTPRCPRWRRSELRAAVDACRAPARIPSSRLP